MSGANSYLGLRRPGYLGMNPPPDAIDKKAALKERLIQAIDQMPGVDQKIKTAFKGEKHTNVPTGYTAFSGIAAAAGQGKPAR